MESLSPPDQGSALPPPQRSSEVTALRSKGGSVFFSVPVLILFGLAVFTSGNGVTPTANEFGGLSKSIGEINVSCIAEVGPTSIGCTTSWHIQHATKTFYYGFEVNNLETAVHASSGMIKSAAFTDASGRVLLSLDCKRICRKKQNLGKSLDMFRSFFYASTRVYISIDGGMHGTQAEVPRDIVKALVLAKEHSELIIVRQLSNSKLIN